MPGPRKIKISHRWNSEDRHLCIHVLSALGTQLGIKLKLSMHYH